MVTHLYPKFLEDPSEYQEAMSFWRHLWSQVSPLEQRVRGWRWPWLFTGSANDRVFMDGNPMFSAYSPTRRCGIRVIQYPPTSNQLEFDYWLDTFGGELGEPETIRELVIACALSEEAARRASELMEMWCSRGEIVESQPYVRVIDYALTEIPIALAASC